MKAFFEGLYLTLPCLYEQLWVYGKNITSGYRLLEGAEETIFLAGVWGSAPI